MITGKTSFPPNAGGRATDRLRSRAFVALHNRLKMLKSQMYGRANLDLLNGRFLFAA
jgi:hypothetical protein